MKHTHLYDRLSNPNAYKIIMKMISESNMEVVQELYDNLKTNASNHPKFNELQKQYDERVKRHGEP